MRVVLGWINQISGEPFGLYVRFGERPPIFPRRLQYYTHAVYENPHFPKAYAWDFWIGWDPQGATLHALSPKRFAVGFSRGKRL